MVKAQKMAVGEARASRPSGTRRTAELAAAAAAAPHSSYSNGSGETEESIANSIMNFSTLSVHNHPTLYVAHVPLLRWFLRNSDLSIR